MASDQIRDPQVAESTDQGGRPPRRQRHIVGGLLPFIGVFLFLIATANQFRGGVPDGWESELVSNGVVYMIGWAGVGAGISHLFFGERISKTIGYAHNDYELEVGAADFAMGVVALMAASQSQDFWWAVILISSVFRVICGVVHVRSIIRDKNFAPNNTTILLVDFLVPAFLVFAYLAWL